jgi:hypothetical protein
MAPARPAGSVTFRTMICPRRRFVNVQVTVSPGGDVDIRDRTAVVAGRAHEIPAGGHLLGQARARPCSATAAY